MPSLAAIPALILSAVLFYGGFSRLTHGTYTPGFYAHQIVRQPDDGSVAAMMPPVMDVALGLWLVLGSRRSKVRAALLFGLAQTYGLVLMLRAGEDTRLDIVLLALAGLVVGIGFLS